MNMIDAVDAIDAVSAIDTTDVTDVIDVCISDHTLNTMLTNHRRDRTSVLVVEDNQILLMGISALLEAEGYEVFAAADGVQALQLLEQETPDLIVTDIMMPEMDGYALCEALHAHREWMAIPVIFLTARASSDDILRGKALGVEDYITKPFEPEELLVAVRSRLDRAQAIRASNDAELDQIKEWLIMALSHELRTPLTYVHGYTDMVLENIPSLSEDEVTQYLRGIKYGANRLSRLVEDLLLLVQLDGHTLTDEVSQEAELFPDLDIIINNELQRHAKKAAEHGIQLSSEFAPILPQVRICERYFTDALGRLIDNAIKFSQGSAVAVRVRAVNDHVEIAIADQGIGIPVSEIRHLFQRFRQIDRKQREQQGLGLGLAIARELILLHGGEITVDSEPGQGSTFTIHLPANRSA